MTTHETSQSKGRDAVAEWTGTPKQVRELMEDSYKPSDYQFGFLELAKVIFWGLLTAAFFIVLTMAVYFYLTDF